MKTRLPVDWEEVQLTCKVIFFALAAARTAALADEPAAKPGAVAPPTVS